MRLLVACPDCNRQYDASKLGIGRRFRCHCGDRLSRGGALSAAFGMAALINYFTGR